MCSSLKRLRCGRVVVAENTIVPSQTLQLVQARAPLRELSDGPRNTLLECTQLRPGVSGSRAMIPGHQDKVTATSASVLSSTAERQAHAIRREENSGDWYRG